MQKLLIFGGLGFIGENAALYFRSRGYDVYAADMAKGSSGSARKVDIRIEKEVASCIDELRPDLVINTAAVADIDKAEQNKELASGINIDGAMFICKACLRKGIRYIFFSSDAVFSGEDRMYTEESPVSPVNFYGETKAEAEKAIRSLYPQSVVVRISLALGFPIGEGNSFIAALKKKLETGMTVPCPTSEIRTPIDVATLSECLWEIDRNGFSGILHIGASQSINRFELTKRIAAKLQLDQSLVVPAEPTASPLRAPRHKNGILNVNKASLLFNRSMPDIETVISRACNVSSFTQGSVK